MESRIEAKAQVGTTGGPGGDKRQLRARYQYTIYIGWSQLGVEAEVQKAIFFVNPENLEIKILRKECRYYDKKKNKIK